MPIPTDTPRSSQTLCIKADPDPVPRSDRRDPARLQPRILSRNTGTHTAPSCFTKSGKKCSDSGPWSRFRKRTNKQSISWDNRGRGISRPRSHKKGSKANMAKLPSRPLKNTGRKRWSLPITAWVRPSGWALEFRTSQIPASTYWTSSNTNSKLGPPTWTTHTTSNCPRTLK